MSPYCKKKVRIVGKEVHYQFKFNLAGRRREACERFLKLRSDRLQEQEQYEHNLAILPSKDLLLDRSMFTKFNKESHAKAEMVFARLKHDSDRMDDLTAQLHSLRQKEASAVEKISKVELRGPGSYTDDHQEAPNRVTHKKIQHLNTETVSSGQKRTQTVR